jgi:hypothetical protein|tara:strand:+ start:71 stop:598 length:528 start_codon:yes stop_codon:yes gene_type:complete
MKGKRMNRETAKKKLGEILKKEVIKELQHLYIKQDKYGAYTLFNEYRIKQDSDNYFEITNKQWEYPKTFTSIKNAVSFTVLHKHNNVTPAKELETLDSKLSSVDVELQMHKILLKKAKDLDTYFIFQTKIQNDTDKKQYILKELRQHINSSKRFQDSLFDQKLKRDKDLKFRKRR